MKKYILGIFPVFLMSWVSSFGQGETVELQFSNLKSMEGQILVAFFEEEDSFLDETDLSFIVSMDELSENAVRLEGIPKGAYAISIIHDKNKNMELDKGGWGIPKEPFGFSNNPRLFMGPPKFEDCLVEVDGETVVEIEMKEMKLGG